MRTFHSLEKEHQDVWFVHNPATSWTWEGCSVSRTVNLLIISLQGGKQNIEECLTIVANIYWLLTVYQAMISASNPPSPWSSQYPAYSYILQLRRLRTSLVNHLFEVLWLLANDGRAQNWIQFQLQSLVLNTSLSASLVSTGVQCGLSKLGWLSLSKPVKYLGMDVNSFIRTPTQICALDSYGTHFASLCTFVIYYHKLLTEC